MGKKKALEFLEKLELHGCVFGLERIEKFLSLLGNPECDYKIIHVAGTNGKGSACAFIASILQKAGYKTGLYTSPHLIEFNERIRINGKKISGNELISLISILKAVKEKNEIKKNKFSELKKLTYFEFTTALAFRHFADKKIDFLVCETGMGGKLDATNVATPMVSVITNVSMEHERYLGNTLEKIAVEKAGIIKEKTPMVTGESNPKILSIFRKKCAGKKSPFYVLGKNFPIKKLKISLMGKFQQKNANLAVSAIKILQSQGIEIPKKAINEGLFSANWAGRFQIIGKNPTIVLDAGHNIGCMLALKDSIKSIFPKQKVLLVMGISSDKNISKMVEIISPIVKKAIACKARIRGSDAKLLKRAFEKNKIDSIEIENIPKAIKYALCEAKKSDIMLVSGSCFVVGEALEFFKIPA